MHHSFNLSTRNQPSVISGEAPTGAQVKDALALGTNLSRARRYDEAVRVLWAGFDPRNLIPHDGNNFALFFNAINSGADVATVDATRDLLLTLGDTYENLGEYNSALCCYHAAISPDTLDTYAWGRVDDMESNHGAQYDETLWNKLVAARGVMAAPSTSVSPAPRP